MCSTAVKDVNVLSEDLQVEHDQSLKINEGSQNILQDDNKKGSVQMDGERLKNNHDSLTERNKLQTKTETHILPKENCNKVVENNTCIDTEVGNNKKALTNVCNEKNDNNSAGDKNEIFAIDKISDGHSFEELNKTHDTPDSNDLDNIKNISDAMSWRTPNKEDSYTHRNQNVCKKRNSLEEVSKTHDTPDRNDLVNIKNVSHVKSLSTPLEKNGHTPRKQNMSRKKHIVNKLNNSEQNKKPKKGPSVFKEIKWKINSNNILYEFTEEELQAYYKKERLGMDISDEEREILQLKIVFKDGTKKDVFSVYKEILGKETLSSAKNVIPSKNNLDSSLADQRNKVGSDKVSLQLGMVNIVQENVQKEVLSNNGKNVQDEMSNADKGKVQEEININNKEIVERDVISKSAEKQLVGDILSADEEQAQGETVKSNEEKVQKIFTINEEKLQEEVFNTDKEKIKDEKKEQQNKNADEKKTQDILNVDGNKSAEVSSNINKERSRWRYICHICKKNSFNTLSCVQNHIKGKQHTNLASRVNSLTKERFAVRIVEGIHLKSGLIEENSTPIIEKLINQCFKPLIGIEYVTEVLQIFKGRVKSVVYHCLLCDFKGYSNDLIGHLQSLDHCNKYLAKFFTSIHRKIKKPASGKVKYKQQIKHIVGRIQFLFGRLKPVQVQRVGVFDPWKKCVLEVMENGPHFREVSNFKYFLECHLPKHSQQERCKDSWRLRLKLEAQGKFDPKKFIIPSETSSGDGRKRKAEMIYQGNFSQSQKFSTNNESNWGEWKRTKYEKSFTNTGDISRNVASSSTSLYDIPNFSSNRYDTLDLKRRQSQLSPRLEESGIPSKMSRLRGNNSLLDELLPTSNTLYRDDMYASSNFSRQLSNSLSDRRNFGYQNEMTETSTRYGRKNEEFIEPWQENIKTDDMYASSNFSRQFSNSLSDRRNFGYENEMTETSTRYGRNNEEFREPWQENIKTDDMYASSNFSRQFSNSLSDRRNFGYENEMTETSTRYGRNNEEFREPWQENIKTDDMYGSSNFSRQFSNSLSDRRNFGYENEMTETSTRYGRNNEEFREPWQQNIKTGLNETYTSNYPRNKLGEYPDQQRDSLIEQMRYENENLIFTLKQILTFDKYFSYLKPKVLNLLTEALKRETFGEYEDSLLSSIDNNILLETVKEKLTAYLENRLIDGQFVQVAESAIKEITELTLAGSRKVSRLQPRKNELFERKGNVELCNQREMTSHVSREFFDYTAPEDRASNLTESRYSTHHGKSTNVSHSYSHFNKYPF